MSSTRILVVAGLALSVAAVAASATGLEQEALARGYRPVPSGSGAVAGADGARPALAYVKVTEPGRSMSVLGAGPAQASEASRHSRHSVAVFDINCARGAVKYRSVHPIDATWNDRASGMPLPISVWHVPARDSLPALALGVACQG